MKRIILLSLVIFLCLPLAVYAASIGGAETQGQGKFSIGLDQEFVFDRDMKFKSIDPALGPGETLEMKTEIDKMYRTMVKTNYGVLDNLDVYIKLGIADFESKTNYTWRDTTTGDWEKGNMKLKGDNAFAYGFGAKGTYNLEDDLIIGCDIQYLRHKNDYKGTGSWEDSAGLSDEESFKGKITFQEWHVAPYIAKKLESFVPYFGVKYSDLRQEGKIEQEDGDEDEKVKYEADDNFGVFLGTDYKLGENWALNLEARFIDETAISFGGTYRF